MDKFDPSKSASNLELNTKKKLKEIANSSAYIF